MPSASTALLALSQPRGTRKLTITTRFTPASTSIISSNCAVVNVPLLPMSTTTTSPSWPAAPPVREAPRGQARRPLRRFRRRHSPPEHGEPPQYADRHAGPSQSRHSTSPRPFYTAIRKVRQQSDDHQACHEHHPSIQKDI